MESSAERLSCPSHIGFWPLGRRFAGWHPLLTTFVIYFAAVSSGQGLRDFSASQRARDPVPTCWAEGSPQGACPVLTGAVSLPGWVGCGLCFYSPAPAGEWWVGSRAGFLLPLRWPNIPPSLPPSLLPHTRLREPGLSWTWTNMQIQMRPLSSPVVGCGQVLWGPGLQRLTL